MGNSGKWGFCCRLISNGARACHVIICLLLDLQTHGVVPGERSKGRESINEAQFVDPLSVLLLSEMTASHVMAGLVPAIPVI
jgi:hypothetical protein